MKESILNKSDLPIDLTSLLDIIFIILLIVICNQKINMIDSKTEAEAIEAQAEEIRAEAAEAEKEAHDIISEAESYKEQLENYAELNDYLTMVTVYVDYTPRDIKNRTIRIIVNESEKSRIELNPDTKSEAMKQLKNDLVQIMKSYTDVPVIISINRDNILYRDENSVRDVIDGLCREFGNLYMK